MSPTPSILTCTVVGSGAVRVNPTRGGPAYIVRVADDTLLLDCGRCAVHNLARCGIAAEDVTRILLTHLHVDHVCDLPYLLLLSWNNGRRTRLPIHGPPGTAAFLEHAVRLAYRDDIDSRLAHGKDLEGLLWDVTEIDADGEILRTPRFCLTALRTPHGRIANFNYRIDAGGRRVVISSDTQDVPALVDFCRDADLLVCECSGTAEFLAARPWGTWHMTPQAVGRLASAAGVRHVVLKHLVIEDWTDAEGVVARMAADVRREYAGTVDVGVDGLTVELTATETRV